MMYPRILCYVTLLLMVCGSCKNDDIYEQIDYHRINYVVDDNINLSFLQGILKRTGMDKELNTDGPFTLLAPSNDAFVKEGITSAGQAVILPIDFLEKLSRYHVLPGYVALDKLPLKLNQELSTLGGKIYVTHWVKGQDTVITVNGARILEPINFGTNNGLVQVIDKVLDPTSYMDLNEAMADNPTVSLFSQAIKIADMEKLLEGNEIHTVFAPDNNAMKSYGYPTLQSLLTADPAKLKQLIRSHILKDRRFESDFFLLLPAPTVQGTVQINTSDTPGNPSRTWVQGQYSSTALQMLDGSEITFLIEKGSYLGVERSEFKLMDKSVNRINLLKKDIIASNGILHVVDRTINN